jgi:cell division protease FtsH
MDKKTSFNIWYVVAAIVAVLVIQYFFVRGQTVEQIVYSEFLYQLEAGNIEEITVSESKVRGKFRNPIDGKSYFVTHRIEPALAQDLEKYNVRFAGETEETFFGTLLSWIVPVLFFFGLWYFFFRRVISRGGLGGGFMEVGRSKARVYMERSVDVTFDDVAGVDEAKDELKEIIEFLRDPERYGRLGGRLPKGILLVGPPGTGKTLLARAVAGEAGVPFFSISGAEFVEMFVGVGAARVRDLFEQARKKAPCIIFIDELDALGRARGVGPLTGGHDEKEQTLNQLLAELDGFDPSSGIVLLGATNRPEILDPALLRAGRFDRQVLVDRPDKVGRVQILKIHMRKVRLASEVDPEAVAALTPGFSGADLANLVNEAALLATRRNAKAVGMDDFTAAIERIVAGLEKKSRLLNLKEREIVAYHEMGHALVALSLPGTDPVHKVSIIPRGIGALGYTIQRPTEDRYLMAKKELENKMTVLLGGRAAESLVFEETSTGAGDDLAKATNIARSMVTQYGMDPSLGQVAYEVERTPLLGEIPGAFRERHYSEETAREIDCAVRSIVDGAFTRAREILKRRRATLDAGAEALLEHETLSADDLEAVIERTKTPGEEAGGTISAQSG